MKILPLTLLLLLPGIASAAPLKLGEALARVDANHPWLRDRSPLTALASARTTLAETAPPLEASVSFENALGTGEFSGVRSLETTLQLNRALAWADRRNARVSVAEALSNVDRAAWEERRRELLAETARRFIRVAATQAILSLAREQSALAQQTVAAVEARIAQAASSASDLARAKLALVEHELAAEHEEHLLLSARQSLAALWGAAKPDFDHATADLVGLPEVPGYDVLAGRLTAAPAQVRFAALARWRSAEERLSLTAARRGETRWSAGLRRSEATDDFGFVFGLSRAWPSRQTGDAHATEARAERDRTTADAEAALLETHAALFGLCQELNHARIEFEAARDQMVPAATAWRTSMETGHTSGRYELRDVLEARATLFTVRRRQAQAAAEYHLTLVAVEQLLGGPANL